MLYTRKGNDTAELIQIEHRDLLVYLSRVFEDPWAVVLRHSLKVLSYPDTNDVVLTHQLLVRD